MHPDNTKVFDTLSGRRFHVEIHNGKAREITLQGVRYLQGLGACLPRAGAVTGGAGLAEGAPAKASAKLIAPQLPLHTSPSHGRVTGTGAPSARISPAVAGPTMADGAPITK